MRVLVVDDDRVQRKTLETLIARAGFEVVTASNGQEALARMAEVGQIQLVVADWMMPEMDGLTLCREVRRRFQERYVYFVLVTSRDRQDDRLEGFDAGADDYVVKPVHHAELKARIRAAARIIDLQDQLLAAQERLRYQAMHDALTGIWNRRSVVEALEREIERTGREGSALAVAMIDLDHFKRINDTHGHAAGDEVLREAAQRIRGAVRSYDSVGRYGGEEFLVVAPGLDELRAAELAERIRRRFEAESFSAGAAQVPVTLSLGLVSVPGASRPVAARVLAAADEALYQAKRDGRNRTVVGRVSA